MKRDPARTFLRAAGAAALVLAAAALGGCEGYYQPAQVAVTKALVRADNLTLIQFETLPETLFYCPRVEVQTEAKKINLRFVRAPVSLLGANAPAVNSIGFYNPQGLPVFITDGTTALELGKSDTPATRPAK